MEGEGNEKKRARYPMIRVHVGQKQEQISINLAGALR